MKRRNKKGQTAMEYLMTYGWAIIIVIIVGVALWRLGVFSPSAGKVSTGFDEFSIAQNFRITADGTATVVVTNQDKQSRTVILESARMTTSTDTVDWNTPTLPSSLGAGDSLTLTFNLPTGGSVGSPYSVELTLEYTVDGITYNETGKLSGKYE